MTKVTLVPVRPAPTKFDCGELNLRTSIGKLVRVIHDDMSMVGIIVKESEGGDNGFCPLLITKKAGSKSSDIPFDFWPIKNLFYSGGEVESYDGGINIK